jgi:hypothetical protein
MWNSKDIFIWNELHPLDLWFIAHIMFHIWCFLFLFSTIMPNLRLIPNSQCNQSSLRERRAISRTWSEVVIQARIRISYIPNLEPWVFPCCCHVSTTLWHTQRSQSWRRMSKETNNWSWTSVGSPHCNFTWRMTNTYYCVHGVLLKTDRDTSLCLHFSYLLSKWYI